MKPTLETIETLALQAGEILGAGFGQSHQISHKGVIDLVTEMDQRAEDFLLGEIRRSFPSDRIISEESGELEGDASRVWYVDPLDGTVNYAHGIPQYGVSIAYIEDGIITLGVVYNPTIGEFFSAEKGRGAFLNGQPVRVSGAQTLDQSLLATGFPYDIRTHPENNLENCTRVSLLSRGVRRLGSAALDMCYVAAGRFDGFWELRLKGWDVAAGGLIAAEAGAMVTSVKGDPDYLDIYCSILAATPAVHPQMLKILSGR